MVSLARPTFDLPGLMHFKAKARASTEALVTKAIIALQFNIHRKLFGPLNVAEVSDLTEH